MSGLVKLTEDHCYQVQLKINREERIVPSSDIPLDLHFEIAGILGFGEGRPLSPLMEIFDLQNKELFANSHDSRATTVDCYFYLPRDIVLTPDNLLAHTDKIYVIDNGNGLRPKSSEQNREPGFLTRYIRGEFEAKSRSDKSTYGFLGAGLSHIKGDLRRIGGELGIGDCADQDFGACVALFAADPFPPSASGNNVALSFDEEVHNEGGPLIDNCGEIFELLAPPTSFREATPTTASTDYRSRQATPIHDVFIYSNGDCLPAFSPILDGNGVPF